MLLLIIIICISSKYSISSIDICYFTCYSHSLQKNPRVVKVCPLLAVERIDRKPRKPTLTIPPVSPGQRIMGNGPQRETGTCCFSQTKRDTVFQGLSTLILSFFSGEQ